MSSLYSISVAWCEKCSNVYSTDLPHACLLPITAQAKNYSDLEGWVWDSATQSYAKSEKGSSDNTSTPIKKCTCPISHHGIEHEVECTDRGEYSKKKKEENKNNG